jgi:ribosomal protein L30E
VAGRETRPGVRTAISRKKMVLVADNAPYHHKRVIGSLASVSKKKIVEMMVEHSVKYINLPLTDK